jgi:putative transposon-encoded protein
LGVHGNLEKQIIEITDNDQVMREKADTVYHYTLTIINNIAKV